MTEAELIGRRIREARERRDISQQKVADALGIPRTAVTNIEAGTRNVSTLELTKLGALFNLSPAAFLEGSAVSDLAVVRARALSEATSSPEFGPVIDRMIDFCREGAELRRLLEQDTTVSMPNYAQRIANSGDAVRQGEARAREERRRLGLGNAPIGNLPELIGDQGIWVASAAKDDFPDDVSGLFLHHASIGMAVLINGSHKPVRQRFSYAHEYGHALFDRQEELAPDPEPKLKRAGREARECICRWVSHARRWRARPAPRSWQRSTQPAGPIRLQCRNRFERGSRNPPPHRVAGYHLPGRGGPRSPFWCQL